MKLTRGGTFCNPREEPGTGWVLPCETRAFPPNAGPSNPVPAIPVVVGCRTSSRVKAAAALLLTACQARPARAIAPARERGALPARRIACVLERWGPMATPAVLCPARPRGHANGDIRADQRAQCSTVLALLLSRPTVAVMGSPKCGTINKPGLMASRSSPGKDLFG